MIACQNQLAVLITSPLCPPHAEACVSKRGTPCSGLPASFPGQGGRGGLITKGSCELMGRAMGLGNLGVSPAGNSIRACFL